MLTTLLFAESLSGGQLILVGALLVGAAFVLRRTAAGGKRARTRDPLREMHEDFRQAESTYSAQLNQMEVRLYEFSRDVEARVETRLAMLDQLILDADREIGRLELLLGMTQPGSAGVAAPSSRGPRVPDIVVPQATNGAPARTAHVPKALPAPAGLSVDPALNRPAVGGQEPDPRRSIYALYDSGFSPQEIADAVRQPLGHVVLLLKLRPAPGQADAA